MTECKVEKVQKYCANHSMHKLLHLTGHILGVREGCTKVFFLLYKPGSSLYRELHAVKFSAMDSNDYGKENIQKTKERDR